MDNFSYRLSRYTFNCYIVKLNIFHYFIPVLFCLTKNNDIALKSLMHTMLDYICMLKAIAAFSTFWYNLECYPQVYNGSSGRHLLSKKEKT